MSEPFVQAMQGDVPYQVTLTNGVHRWLSDVSHSMGGVNSGPSPHQLLLSALGACTAITVSMYAKRKSMPLVGIHVELSIVEEQRSPAIRTEILRTLELRGELEPAQRLRLLEVANACPIHTLLNGTVDIRSQLATQEQA
ncbi:OsmC family protein [Pseudomonas yamanorum]|nr:OsmC family protein [Pseudomonas yamanorum]